MGRGRRSRTGPWECAARTFEIDKHRTATTAPTLSQSTVVTVVATDVQYWLSSVLTSATAALLCFATSGRAEWHVARRTERGAAVN